MAEAKDPELDKEIQEGKLLAALGYMFVLCLLPLLLGKENKFAYHHGKQGLVLFIGEVAALIIGVIPFLGWVICRLAMFIFGLLSIVGIIQALKGKYWKMPVISDIVSKINI